MTAKLKFIWLALGIAGLLPLVFSGCAEDTVEPDVSTVSDAIRNGFIFSDDAADAGPTVTVLGQGAGSGVLIDIGGGSSNAVLTAAHVIWNEGRKPAHNAVTVYIGNPNESSVFTPAQTATSVKWYPYPTYSPSLAAGQWSHKTDLAIIFLDKALGQGATRDCLAVGDLLSDEVIVQSGFSAEPRDYRYGVKNWAILPVTNKYGTGSIIPLSHFWMGEDEQIGQHVIPGDCGSGVFHETSGKLVGIVNDWVTRNAQGNQSIALTIGPNCPWIDERLQTNPAASSGRVTGLSVDWDLDTVPDDVWIEQDGGALAFHVNSSLLGGELPVIPVTIPDVPESIDAMTLGNFDGNGIQMALVGEEGVHAASLISGVDPFDIFDTPDKGYVTAFAAPLDNDGYDDLVALDEDGRFDVFWGSAAGLYHDDSAKVAIAQLDDDGIPDPMALIGDTVYYSNASGYHAPLVPTNLVDGYQLVVGKFQGQGRDDIAIVGQGDSGTAIVFECSPNSSGSLVCDSAIDASFMAGGRRPQSIQVGDFNEDGFDDLQVSYEGNEPRRVFWGSTGGLSSSRWGRQHSFPTTSDTDQKYVQVQGLNELTYFRQGSYYWYVQADRPTGSNDRFSIEVYHGGYDPIPDSLTGNAEGCFKVIPDQNVDRSTNETLSGYPPIDYFDLDVEGWSTLAAGRLSDYDDEACNSATNKCTFRIEVRSGMCDADEPADSGGNAFKLRMTGLEPVRVLRDGFVFVNRGSPFWDININVPSGSSGELNLIEADADSIHGDPPGRESVANEIWYELWKDSTPVELVRTDASFRDDLSDPVYRVDGIESPDAPPSGNWMEYLDERSIEYYRYDAPEPGNYTWHWGDVRQGNMIFVSNAASPAAHQMSAEPVGPMKASVAAPVDTWVTADPGTLALPVVLGGGTFGGDTTVVNTVVEARAILDARNHGSTAALLAELLTAKLNAASASAVGETLREAHLNGNALRVSEVMDEADRIVEQGASAEELAEQVRLLVAINEGSINYLPSPLDITERGDEDKDGIVNVADICPLVPSDQVDSNQDGIGDACDPHPFVSCVYRRKDGCSTAVFGYENLHEERRIARGVRNALTGTAKEVQPVLFRSGTVDQAFAANFCPGEEITWTVEGNSATGSAGAPACEAGPLIPPVAGDVVLFASNQLKLSSRVTVESSGNIVNAGTGITYVDANSSTGEIWSRGDVELRDNVVVTGSVHTGGDVIQGNGVEVAGAVMADVPEIAPLDWSMTFPGANNGPVIVEQQSPRSLPPGAYAGVVVRGGATLTLLSGVYYFNALRPEWGSRIQLDDSDGPVYIYVRYSLVFQGEVSSTGGGHPNLLVGYFGGLPALLESGFNGALIAPNAKIDLRTAVHQGFFWARDIEAQSGAVVSYRAMTEGSIPEPSACDDGVCDPSEDCGTCPEDCGDCPSCGDGIQNQGEEGVDCGGPCPIPCGNDNCTCPSGCDSIIAAGVPHVVDGVKDSCYFFDGALGSYVNSWNAQSVNLNGENIANRYVASSQYPAPIDGGYYLYFKSTVPWGHIEAR